MTTPEYKRNAKNQAPLLKRPVAKLAVAAAFRFPDDRRRQADYIRHILDSSERTDGTDYWISREALERLKAEYDPPDPAAKSPLPIGDWTEIAINAATLGQGKKLARKAAKVMGKKDCGCNKRKKKLNDLGRAIISHAAS